MRKTKQSHITILIIGILTLSSIWMVPLASAVEPPVVPGGGEYYTDYGVLDDDTYVLYPWDNKRITVGFSKYGEMIDDNNGIGLKYNDIDAFANSMISKVVWCSGWVMDIHYVEGGYLKNTWAYALYTDRTIDGVAGEWQNGQKTKDASDPTDTPGGRRTNGFAESAPIKLIYDGPRKAIYLLETTIYDKEQESTPLVEVTIQLVFNKVKKYVMEIKDIKRIDNNKMDGPFQIEFSQRAEWDLGQNTAPRSYAEFYNNLTTKYVKHPFYYPEGERPANYDLCQIISDPTDPNEDKLVGYAAFWPPLISKWVTETYNVKRLSMELKAPSLLSSMETYEHHADLPTNADDLVDPWIAYDETTGEIVILLPKPPVPYPRGEGEWTEVPWVFKKDVTGDYAKLLEMDPPTPGQWVWVPGEGPYGAVRILPFEWSWGDEFLVLYKRVMMGHTPHESTALECMEPLFMPGDLTYSYGMVDEPDTPYVFGEWDFDLDLDSPANSTQQFRCVSVYGITDHVNAVDPDEPEGVGAGEFRIESEVLYQLDEVFNPIDLQEVIHKEAFRWCQKGTLSTTFDLMAHLYDKYGNERQCLDGVHELMYPDKWGYYCRDSEKILLMDSSGSYMPVLLDRSEYDITDFLVTITNGTALSRYDRYKVLYSTHLLQREGPWMEDSFTALDHEFEVEMEKECNGVTATWKIQLSDLGPHTSTGVQVVTGNGIDPLFTLGWSPGESTVLPVFKPYNGGWGAATTDLPPGMMVSGGYNEDYYEITIPLHYLGDCYYWAVNTEATSPGYFPDSSSHQMHYPANWIRWTGENMEQSCCLDWHTGRWEWTVIGDFAKPSDSLGAAMVTAAMGDWKNKQTWLSGLDICSKDLGPCIPMVMRAFDDRTVTKEGYYHNYPDDMRSSFRDDWCTPDDWAGETIYPYAVSSSDVMVIGGPLANLAADYFNDFTDALIFTEYGEGFYGPGCWARTVEDHYQGKDLIVTPDNELWYSSDNVEDKVGYALVSTYKDLNETTGFVVYGYTAEDTYYACYALRGGLLAWLQQLQPGATSILLEIDYDDLHPVQFHVVECLGPFTECTGFMTNFKTSEYYTNYEAAKAAVEDEAMRLGICYKLVDIGWCAQVHPDP